MRPKVRPTGVERTFDPDELIVSKTNLKGEITYANDVFCRIAGYRESEVVGAPHNIIRHPDMPRCVFKLLWDRIQSGKEIFAYVVNLAENGDHYWVLAHVTPTFDVNGTIIGYHSNRRVPEKGAVTKVRDLYAKLRAEERKHGDRKEGLDSAQEMLQALLKDSGMEYDEFAFSL